MHHNRRGFVRMSGAAASLAALGLSGRAGAQDGQPLDVVKIVTGFPPGGTSDTLCRRVAENLRGGSLHQERAGREQGGRGRPDRRAVDEGRADRRQRHPADAGLDADDLSAHLQEAGLRRLHRRHGRDARLHLRFRLLRRPRGARQREDDSGVPRLVQGQSRTRPTTARRRPARCRTSSACCWARRAASS